MPPLTCSPADMGLSSQPWTLIPEHVQVSGGFYGFTAPKPSLLLVSSAATERNALIGEDSEARKADIPIVQLNPGGVLNHKYAGEQAVRGLGLPYTVIRPVGESALVSDCGSWCCLCFYGRWLAVRIK